MMLRKVISGGQTGADQAGLIVAKKFCLETGGWMPNGFRTLTGPDPELARTYGLLEHSSPLYPPRTEQNVADADATIRLAGDFDSAGEVCTLKYIRRHMKPHFDVDLADPPSVEDAAKWLSDNGVVTLNVAGNTDRTYKGCFEKASAYLTELFFTCGLEMVVTDDDILAALGVKGRKIVYTSDRTVLDFIKVRQMGSRTKQSWESISKESTSTRTSSGGHWPPSEESSDSW